MVKINKQQGYNGSESAATTVKKALNTFYDTTKQVLTEARLKLNVGNNTEDRAQRYITKCWNHMVRNEVEQAKQAYDKLVEAYENMEEGEAKKQTYYEVRDIYERISNF